MIGDYFFNTDQAPDLEDGAIFFAALTEFSEKFISCNYNMNAPLSDKEWESLDWIKENDKIIDRGERFNKMEEIVEDSSIGGMEITKSARHLHDSYNSGLIERFTEICIEKLNSEFSNSLCKYGKFQRFLYGDGESTQIVMDFVPNLRVN